MKLVQDITGWLTPRESTSPEVALKNARWRRRQLAGATIQARRPAARPPGESLPATVEATGGEPDVTASPAASRSLVGASRVCGSIVYSADGRKDGRITDLSIDKASGRVLYALVGFGGFFGYADRFHPIPWGLLAYDTARGGYVIPFDAESLRIGPSLSRRQLKQLGVGGEAWHARLDDYYAAYEPIPYF